MLHAGPGISFAVLGAAFLTLTGAEAMYADMGHFRPLAGPPRLVRGRFSGSRTGQGGLLLADPSAIENPFYLLAPDALHYPMVAFVSHRHRLAGHHLRRVLAAQQAIQLGFPPRMRVLHTASHEKGQIYMPMVNWLLAAGTLGAVITFGSSDARRRKPNSHERKVRT